jgi:hypothetical protein
LSCRCESVRELLRSVLWASRIRRSVGTRHPGLALSCGPGAPVGVCAPWPRARRAGAPPAAARVVQVWGCLSLSTKSHRIAQRRSRTRNTRRRGPIAMPIALRIRRGTPPRGPRNRTTGEVTSPPDTPERRSRLTYLPAGSPLPEEPSRKVHSVIRVCSLGRVLSITTPSIDESVHTVCFTPSSDPHARAEGEWTALLAGTGSG